MKEEDKDLFSLIKKKEEENQEIKELLLRKEKELAEQQNNALKVELELQKAKIREFFDKKEKETHELKEQLQKKEDILKNILEEKTTELKSAVNKRDEEIGNLRAQLAEVTGGLSKSIDAIITQKFHQPVIPPLTQPMDLPEIKYKTKDISEKLIKIKELEELTKDLKDEIKRKEARIAELDVMIEDVKAGEELKKNQFELRINRILQEKNELVAGYEKEITTYKEKIKELKSLLAEKEKEINTTKITFEKEATELKNTINNHIDEINMLRSEILQKEREKQNIIESRTQIQNNIVNLQAKFEDERKAFETMVSEKEKEFSLVKNTLDFTIDDLNSKLTLQTEEVGLFKKQITTLQEQIKKDALERDKIYKQKEEEKLTLKKQLDVEKNFKSEIQEDNQKIKITLAQVEQELKMLKKRFRIFFWLEKAIFLWKK